MLANCSRLLAAARKSSVLKMARAFAAATGDAKRVVRIKTDEDLTPFQKWCVEGGVERAYTGNIWFERDVGTYHCIRCDKELFR